MGSSGWVAAIAAGLSAIGLACAGDGDVDRGSGGLTGGGAGRGGPSIGSDGVPQGDGPGSGDDFFGNSDAPTPNTPPPMTGDGMMTPMGDGNCEVGVFCAPNEPDPDNCGTLRLEADVEVTRNPGNLLVLFDQSGSMEDAWGAQSKLQAAQTALVNAITPLQDDLTVGAIFFPTAACVPLFPPPDGGAVAPIDGFGQIPFQPGPQFLNAWAQHWNMLGGALGIGTPMNEAFDRADQALQNASLEGAIAVVAFTDGEPNCLTDPNLSGAPTMPEPQRAAGWLADRNISTYMVGLPGANGVQVLEQVAMSGGTGTYILPDDPAQLEATLAQVVSETVSMGFDSCSITLTPAAEVPEDLLMIVEEPGTGTQRVPRDLGWSLSDDGAHVEITGALCDDAMGGRFNSITFEYACPDVELPPPLKPPE